MKELRNFLKTASDEEVLEAVFVILDQRVELSTSILAQPGGDEGVYTHESIIVRSGDLFFSSSAVPLDWPLARVQPDIGELN